MQGDLSAGFGELQRASHKSIAALRARYEEYITRRDDIERNMLGLHETQRRARMRVELEYEFVRRLFAEALPQFESQYGREVEAGQTEERNRRIVEAFVADSVAALIARVLFLRLVEDLGLTRKRRLTNGGPRNWAAFVEFLTGDARALVRFASEDVARVYREPFAHTVFDWIHHANGELDEALQRFILRLNAYDFSGLSEEIIGDIYQQFLPPQKRKQLGEYYTPPSIVDWILDRTVRAHGLGPLLDPSCGSGSFLVRYAHGRLGDAGERHLDRALVRGQVQEEVWGFDLNPFAAFISLFQITWALLRFRAAGEPAPRPCLQRQQPAERPRHRPLGRRGPSGPRLAGTRHQEVALCRRQPALHPRRAGQVRRGDEGLVEGCLEPEFRHGPGLPVPRPPGVAGAGRLFGHGGQRRLRQLGGGGQSLEPAPAGPDGGPAPSGLAGICREGWQAGLAVGCRAHSTHTHH